MRCAYADTVVGSFWWTCPVLLVPSALSPLAQRGTIPVCEARTRLSSYFTFDDSVLELQ